MLADVIGLTVVGVTGFCVTALVLVVLVDCVREFRRGRRRESELPVEIVVWTRSNPLLTFAMCETVREFDLGGDDS